MSGTQSGMVGHLRDGVETIRDRPALLTGGLAVALGMLVAALGVQPAWKFSEETALGILRATGRTSRGFGGVYAPKASMLVLRVLVFLVPLGALSATVWTLVGTPAAAAVGRGARTPPDEPLGEHLKDVAERVPSLLAGSVLRRLVALFLAPVVVVGLLALYFSVGTLLAALGYAAGLGVVPRVVPKGVLLLVAVFTWGVVTAALGYVDSAQTPAEGSGGTRPDWAVVDSLRFAMLSPRAALTHGTVVLQLIITPAVVAVALAGALAAASGGFTTPAVVVGLVTYLALGSFGLTLAMVYRVRTFDAVVAPTLSSTDRGFFDLVGRPRTALVAVLVVGLLVGGGAVRVLDLRPGGPSASPPGAVAEDAEPREVIREGRRAIATTEHELVRRNEFRTVYPSNGTKTDWTTTAKMRIAVDRSDGELLRIVSLSYEQGGEVYLSYVTPTGIAQSWINDVEGPRIDRSKLDPEWDVTPVTPNTLNYDHRPRALPVIDTYTKLGRGWNVVDRSNGSITYRTTHPETVMSYSGFHNRSLLVEGAVTVVVDAETGYVERVRARWLREEFDGPARTERRWTAVHRKYGSVDVERPDDADRKPIEVVLDAVFY